MGLYGILVVTTAPSGSTAGTAYAGVTYSADVPLLLSEIDPVQNNSVNTAVNTAGFSETTVWSGQPGGCGNSASPTYNQCYPPAVNYAPLYYLINGTAFSRNSASASLFAATPGTAATPVSGNVLVRFVNAGLRMHVPSIVGSQTGASAAPGFSLIAEDGNPLPGLPRVQSEVFMSAGKTYDVMVNVPAAGGTALPVYDRELSLSGNAIARDAGMLAYLSVNGAGVPAAPAFSAAVANPDTYNSLTPCAATPCPAFTVTDPSKGVIGNDVNVYGVKVLTPPTHGTLTLNANGTFSYTPSAVGTTPDSFTYEANGNPAITATVSLNGATIEGAAGILMSNITYTSKMATRLTIPPPGVLSVDKDSAGYPLRVNLASIPTVAGLTLNMDPNGGFTASVTGAGTYTFTYKAQNSQGTLSATAATVTLVFPQPSNLSVSVVDGKTRAALSPQDYRWIIEEDRTFYVDPNCTTNPPPAGCPTAASGIVPTFGTNFHTSNMPFVAQGCTGPKSCEAGQTVYDPVSGNHLAAVCDVGNGACRTDSTAVNGQIPVLPGQVALDPTKRYYISVLPGDAADPFYAAYGPTTIGHGMGGAPIAAGQTSVTVLVEPSPYPPGKLSVFVFEDDFPLNGEQDAGGGIDVLATNEPGLGGFQIHLWDAMGGSGDFTGQMTYDMFNQPLSNSLAGTIDPATGKDSCPISPNSTSTFNGSSVTATGTAALNTISIAGLTVDNSQIGSQVVITGGNGFIAGTYTITGVTPGTAATATSAAVPGTWTLSANVTTSATASGMTGTRTEPGITGMVVTCPKFESDGVTLSPLAGQAVIANLMPGRWGVIATPGADRIARGEEWLQTNTLDGQKAHDVFTRIGEPEYFQEFGPASFHVTIGFANPKIINSRLPGVCAGTDVNLPLPGVSCNNSVIGSVTTERMSRSPDERLYSSGSHDSFYWTQCYVSIGDPDGEDFAFTKCDANGNFSFSGLPPGDWRVTVFDQWNDMLVDGLSTPVMLAGGNTVNMGQIAMNQWQANLYTRTFADDNKDGVSQSTEGGISLVPVSIRYRDGSLANNLTTDFTGTANFNETFPLFNWYTVETDVTRYKNTGTHVVYDAGGPADGTPCGTAAGTVPCGTSTIGKFLANTIEQISVPTNLRVPGAVYCSNADCTGYSIQNGPGSSAAPTSGSSYLSTGRIDPPWVGVEGWQGFSGQNNFIEFGKTPYVPGENGGIHGHVIYASTRPFDDPQMLVQTQWEPLVPHVTINLYKEGTAADNITPTLTLVDTTQTSSWDDWAQGFRSDGIPNMNCPGQGTSSGVDADLFFFSLYNQPNYLNVYNSLHGGPAPTALPYNSQFKCYDGMHNWNQIQPAPYDGMYSFPSSTGMNPQTGASTGTNCTICISNPDTSDFFRKGTPMLPTGKYVVEVVLPSGYELVKEEDKNILIGDNFIAPVAQQFGGLGNIFIIPDQASVASANTSSGIGYNANNAQNPTQSLGASPNNGIVPAFIPEPTWPCVGQSRIVPDYISLYPQSKQVSPFAGATRNLCDRKEVTLGDQMGATAKFYIYTSTHIASKFAGVITDDFTSEFDPFSPQFGEKFSPPELPVSVKDWTGAEISRVYADHWGAYNGMTYSTWEVNPPNPTGYSPTMMIMCMNDPGTGATPDPLFNPAYSQFCYELPYMPGQTDYLDTPVVPTSAFAGAGYNNVDCAYPAATPAVSEVDGDGKGPWVAAGGSSHPITIHALGDAVVNNYGYSGPSATTAPFNQKTVTRHYGFGTQCTSPTAGSPTCNTRSSVTVGGAPATITSWSDTTIVINVSTTGDSAVPTCAMQQEQQYGGPGTAGVTTAHCGQLVITAGNGKQSVDAVTVTIGGKTPLRVGATETYTTIQSGIDAAAPGDLILVDAGVYNELLLMWKPIRLQGVGAASTVINANTQPAGKLDPWRQHVNCLFGLALNGQPYSTPGNLVPTPGGAAANNGQAYEPLNLYDPTGQASCPATGWNYFNGGPNNPQVDRLPLEAVVGWDTTVNGNLAQLLQEPSLMGAFEGAGITVLAKGVRYPAGVEVFGAGPDTAAGSNIAHEGQFPISATAGTNLLTNSNADCNTLSGSTSSRTGYSSNFLCNPSRIDGLSITDSSQGGGGIYVHAWGHNLEIANNRIYNNTGTMTGGITVGQGESPDALLTGNGGDPLAPAGGFDQQPWTCVPGGIVNGVQNPNPPGFAPNSELPFCYNTNVYVHHNAVTLNSSIGDEVFSGTPAGAGGVTFCTGADYYKFNYNWVCGNLSTGDGGGFAHTGFIYDGDIEHNTILFNQSFNPSIPTNGGGIVIMGAAPDGSPPGSAPGTECGSVTDVDCAPGLPDGTGPGLVINANLIMGNAAEAGSGGGLRLQSVNGTEVGFFPTYPNPTPSASNQSTSPGWNTVTVTNNIIANNVSGWDGAGVSLQDALVVNLINNTIISNDSTASSGVLFNTLGAPEASAPGATNQTTSATTSAPQPAGLVAIGNSANLVASFAGLTLTCPTNHPNCGAVSYPYLANDVFWQNRAFYIGVGSLGTGTLNQQNVVALYTAFTTTQAPSQPQTDATTANGQGVVITGGTGACTPGQSYWDIGVRGDTGPGNHASGYTLAPAYSVLTNASENGSGSNNFLATNPNVVSQYCNGSRIPPEFGGSGYQVPPGIADATVPNPIFNLTPNATVDEGNNWINMSWGPLSETNPVTGATLGNYALAAGSPAIDAIPTSAGAYPTTDFFGNPRPDPSVPNRIDVGAVEFQGSNTFAIASVTGGPLNFGNVPTGTTSAAQTLTLHNTGTANLTGITLTFSSTVYSRPGAGGTCGATLAPAATCTINVVFSPTAVGAANGTLTITASVAVTGSPVTLTGTGIAATAVASVTGGPLAFGNVPTGTTSASQTLTLHNTGNANLTGITVVVTAPFSRPAGAAGGTCGATLAAAATCTINVAFSPTAVGAATGTATITGNVTVTGSPVSLSGTGIARVVAATLTPTTWSVSQTRNCPGTGLGALACLADPAQIFTLTNTGNVPLTGVTAGTLGGTNASEFGLLSTCGNAILGTTTLAPGGTCLLTVQFKPLTAQPTGTKTATISVTDLAGTQTSNLTGTAN
jgi:hypothetical protein